MTFKADLELIEDVVRRAASNTVKHHEVSLAMQALERIARALPINAKPTKIYKAADTTIEVVEVPLTVVEIKRETDD